MRLEKKTYIFVLTFIFLTIGLGLSIPAQSNLWVAVRAGQQIPANAAVAGHENGGQLTLCRARYKNGVHPGKVINGQCNIGWGTDEIGISEFEVYTGKLVFENKARGLANPFIVGGENGGALYLCRAQLYEGGRYLGTHPGKIINGKCDFTYGGTVKIAEDYDIGYIPSSSSMPVDSQNYNIVSIGSGKILDVRGPSLDNGAIIQQWSDARGQQQQWQFQSTGDGYYLIRSVYTEKCVDVKDASREDGAAIQQWTCFGADNQKWKLVEFENTFIIVSKSSGKVLDVAEYSVENGGRIHQWERHNGNNQRWRILRVSN